MLHRRLVGHGGGKGAVDRRPFGLNQIDETVEGQTAATIWLIAHREHVHSVRADTGMHCQGLQAANVLSSDSRSKIEVFPPDGLAPVEVLEAMQKQSGLIFRRPNIPAERHMLPPSATDARPSGIVHRIGALEDLLVVGRQYAAFAAAQILGRLKAEAGGIAERTDRAALPDRAVGLRGVLDDLQSMLCGDGAERGHVRRLSKQMNRHDGAGLAGDDGFLHARRVEQQRSGVDVDERDAKSAIERGGGAGDEREVRHDDLAAVVEAVVIQKRGERNAQRVGAVRHQQAIAAAAIGRPLLRELLRQRLRQSFDAAQEDPAQLRTHAAVPTQEIAVAVGRPRGDNGYCAQGVPPSLASAPVMRDAGRGRLPKVARANNRSQGFA